MNNDEAIALLSAKRAAINATISDLHRYVDENADWKTDVKASKMAAVKSSATSVGVNLTSWTGEPAPPPPVE